MRISTMAGSAKVLVSPRLSVSPQTIFRKIRRMIFPVYKYSFSYLVQMPIAEFYAE